MSDSSSADRAGPFEEQRRVFELLSQETRHLIIQYVLGHPEHLVSLDELDYMIPKSKAAISDQLDNLIEAGILDLYRCESSEDKRDIPSKFYGFTEYGIEVLHEYNYLRGVPVARVLYKNTRKSEKIKRHEEAPRPQLPAGVRATLSLDGSRLESQIQKSKGKVRSVDDQVKLVEAMLVAGITPDHEGLKRRQIEEEVNVETEHSTETLLTHLIELDLVEKVAPSGPETYLVSERINEIINGQVDEEVERNIEELIAHMDGQLCISDAENLKAGNPPAVADGFGKSIKSLLAQEFGVAPEQLESYLREGDKLGKLNAAVEAIEESEWTTKGKEYGKIKFVRPAPRYRLTKKAVEVAEN